ncbi:MAG: site-specific DNA-methyltransferase [Pseudomonadota bacterium]
MQQTRHEVFFDTAERMDQVPDGSVHLIVTSPPYPMIAMWDELFSRSDVAVAAALQRGEGNAAFEMMHRRLDPVWAEVHRVLVPGGFACINIGDATRTVGGDFALYPSHMRIQKALTEVGLMALPGIIWRKQTNAPNKFMGSGVLPAGAYVTLEHEYILIFRKGPKREFVTDPDKQRRRESALFWEERNAWFSDVWFDVKGSRQLLGEKDVRKRSGAFPFDIAQRLIAMYSVKGDRVLDPFLGTATTTAAAMAAGRNSIGYEIDSGLAQTIAQTVGRAAALSASVHRQRLDSHVAFLAERIRENHCPKHRNVPYGFPVVMAQETSLIFNDAVQVERTGSGQWRVDYAQAPQAAYCRDWEAWLASEDRSGALSESLCFCSPRPRQRGLFP